MKRIFLTILFLLITCNAWADSHYVKNGGSDTGTCTNSASPCATIAYVQGQAASGDTIYFDNASIWSVAAPVLTAAEGITYDGSTWGIGTRAKLQAASIPDIFQGVINVGYSNVTLKGLDVDGNDLSLSGIMVAGYADHDNDIENVTIDNCIVYNIGTGVDSGASWVGGIQVAPRNDDTHAGHGVRNLIIKDTTVHDTVREGINIYPAWGTYGGNWIDTVLIRNVTVYSTGANGDQGAPGFGDGLHIKDDARNVTVEFCNLYSNRHTGILYEAYIDDATVAPTNSILRYSLLHDNYYTGINLAHNTGNTADMTVDVYGNISWNNGRTSAGWSSSSQLIISANDWRSSVLNIYNNIFYTDSSVVNVTYPRNVVIGTGTADNYPVYGTPTINFKNNIVYSTDTIPLMDLGEKLTHSNNLIRKESGTDIAVNTYEYSASYASANVTVTTEGAYTYFRKTGLDDGDVDWSTVFVTANMVSFEGFPEDVYLQSNRRMGIESVSANEIAVNKLATGYSVSSTLVTPSKYVSHNYTRATTNASPSGYELTAQTGDPKFAGGDPPTCFSNGVGACGTGTYGTDMVPNTTYFSLQAGSPALGNGAVLSSTYNKAINYAGTSSTYNRGAAWDIGAYEHTYDGGTIVNTGAVFGGISF